MPLNDEILLQGLRNPQTQEIAFRDLFNEYRRPVEIMAFRMTQDKTDTEDIVGEVFADFWEKRLFEKEDIHNFGGLLLKKCYERSLDHIRNKKRRQQFLPTFINIMAKSVLPNLFSGDVHRMLSILSPMQRKAMDLALQGFSAREAATIMEVSERTAESHNFSGRKKLASALRGYKKHG